MVNSSPWVGWMPTLESKKYFVNPGNFIAKEYPYKISDALIPTRCMPITFSLSLLFTIILQYVFNTRFSNVKGSYFLSICYSNGTKIEW